MKTFIETPRLLLRPLTEEDIPGLYELDADPAVHQYLGNKPINTIQESEAILRHIQKQYQENGIGRWAVIDKATQDFIGWAGLKYEKNIRTDLNYYDLGYRLRQKYWGKGIASEAAIEFLKYGFNYLNLNKICAAAHSENIASNKILKKIGFQFVEYFEYDGSVHHWYKMNREDFTILD